MSSNKINDLNSPSPILEPDPSCFLPPATIVARYIVVGTLSIFIWDTFDNILNDYKLLFEHRIRLPTVVYFVSRLSCLGFTISATVFRISTLPTCNVLEKVLNVSFVLTIISTSLLFFFRIRAVFDKNPWVVAVFAGSWLAVVVGCLVPMIKFATARAHRTPAGCPIVNVRPLAAAATIIPLVNDTLVFLSITGRLYRNSYARRTLQNRARILLFGDYLPAFSKAVLQDGQAYYLTIVTVNLITVIMVFNNSIPEILRTILAVPTAALTNIMACRVFRNTIGFLRDTHISSSFISRELNRDPPPFPLEGGPSAC